MTKKEEFDIIEKTVKAFAETYVKPLIDELVELIFDDSKSNCQVINCEKADDIQCGSSICVEENKQLWKDKLDRLTRQFIFKG